MLGKKKKKAEKQFETDINRVVTPMLDMTFQLLFYFVINFRPAITEGQVDLNLPPEETGQPSVTTFDSEDKPDQYKITAYSSGGPIDLLTFTMKEFPPEALSNENMLGELKARLKSIPKPAEGSKSKPPNLKIECDKRLKYSELMQLMNICREQGFKDVGIMPISKGKGAAAE